AASIISIALLAVIVAAPIHALYRNNHSLHEGRNFYHRASDELTRLWHEQTDRAMPAAGGDDGLAFALAFYSSDHPVYDVRIVHPNIVWLSRGVTFESGWAALCYSNDRDCVGSLERTAARSSRFVRSDFVFQSMLLGQPGAIERFTAFVALPYSNKDITPQGLGLRPSVAEDFSAIRRRTGRQYMGKGLNL
ncbi:MAG TPA: hypothetical protein VKJ01_13495, partial [Candidatus Solibacter sp.]|nr:hypothetical protein [Candidatus Solibacter sp.]